MNGRTRILNENELLNRISNDAVFPVTSDTAVYNTLNISVSDYMPFINVHAFTKHNANFTSKEVARLEIPERYRHNGLIATYVYSDSEDSLWIIEQYNNSLIDDGHWSDDSNWKSISGSVATEGDGVLNTTNEGRLSVNSSEPLSGIVNLHRVSKTGTNTDLIGFVGSRKMTVLNDSYNYSGGEIFSYYDTDVAEDRNFANGLYSAVFGQGNKTENSATRSFVTGYQNTVYGIDSIVSGANNTSYGRMTTVFGRSNVVNNYPSGEEVKYSLVAGSANVMNHSFSIAVGNSLYSANDSSAVFGKFNKISGIGEPGKYGDRVFVIGNGTSESNRSDAMWIDWTGYARFNNDVSCIVPSNPSRIHELSKKYDSSDLINSVTYNTTVNGPVSSQALYELYRQFIEDHNAYFFRTISDFRATIQDPSGAHTDDWVDYHEGDQIYITDPLYEQYEGIQEDIYPAFFIANINDEWHDYEFTTDEAYVADSNDSLMDGCYTIARLRLSHISLVGYQKKLFDSLHMPTTQDEVFGGTKNLKTVGGISLLIDNPDDDNIEVLTETTNVVENNNMYPVTSNAVYNFLNSQAALVSNTKPLNTDNSESLPVNSNESLLTSESATETEYINLHKISKTGRNDDLIEYVGLRQPVEPHSLDSRIGGEIFNSYNANTALGTYSHVEGHNNHSSEYADFAHVEGSVNMANNANTHVGGQGNFTNEDYQFVIGKYALPFETPDTNQPLYPQYEYKNTQSVFTIGWGTDDTKRENIFNVSKTGHVWSNYKMTIGDLDHEGVPTITEFGNNDLVTKYYVDNVALGGQTQLYKGWAQNYNVIQQERSPEAGTLYVVGSNDIEYNNVTVNKANLFHVRYGNNWYKIYDIIAFTDTPVNNEFYVVGGTRNTDNTAGSRPEPILLHKVAKTGDYRDLAHTPSVVGFPSVSMQFLSYKINADCTDTIYGTSTNRFNNSVAKQGEPETNAVITQTASLSVYYDSKIRLIFDCDPQWVLDNIVNNADCKYYVQLQRVSGNKWKTVKNYTQEQQQQGHTSMYRRAIAPLNLHTLTPLTELYEDENGDKILADPNKLISYELPYTIRDILMAFAQFGANARCLWDVVYLGTSPKQGASNYKNMRFEGKPVYMKGVNSITTSEGRENEEIKWLNAYAASFRLGVVEYPDYSNSGRFYGPSYWNNFKAMFKYDKVFSTLRCSGKFTNNRIKI